MVDSSDSKEKKVEKNGYRVHIPAYILVMLIAGYGGTRVAPYLGDDEGIAVQTSRYVTREGLDRQLQLHIFTPHPGAVTDREIKMLDARIDKIETGMLARMERIEKKLDDLLLHVSRRTP